MSDISPEDAFTGLVTTLREVGKVLGPATAARFDAPRRPSSSGGVSNPTLDVVLEPRRWALSEEVTRTAYALRLAELNLTRRLTALDKALSDWEGEGTPA